MRIFINYGVDFHEVWYGPAAAPRTPAPPERAKLVKPTSVSFAPLPSSRPVSDGGSSAERVRASRGEGRDRA